MSGLSLPRRRVAALYRIRYSRPGQCGRGRVVDVMNRARIEQILNRFPGKTILIVGDVMLDEFIWGKVRRISPEAPVPVVDVTDQTYLLGGAGNVAANIRALNGK